MKHLYSLLLQWRERHKSERPGSLLYMLVGLGALIWFLVRVVPKPQRAAYPCQRAAFPIASSFVLWLVSLFCFRKFFQRSRDLAFESRWGPAIIFGGMAVAVGAIFLLTPPSTSADATEGASTTPEEHAPVGVGKGLHPGRVVWIHDPQVTDWEGMNSSTLSTDHVDSDVCADMVEKGILTLAGEETTDAAWDALFRHFNRERGKGDVGYTEGETIAFKANFTLWNLPHNTRHNSGSYSNGHVDGTMAMFIALCHQLVDHAGVPASAISVGDTTCVVPEYFREAVVAEFPDMQFFDNLGSAAYGVEKAESSDVELVFHGAGAGHADTDRIPRQFADADYFINWALPKSHGLAGFTACAKNNYGSLIRKPPAGGYFNLHNCLPAISSGMEKYRGLVDLMGHPELGGKTLLYFLDAVFAGIDWDATPVPWESEPFNGDWPSSIFLSQDPVAIDSVAFDFLYAEWPELVCAPDFRGGAEDYLHEAAQADNPPSGSVYDPAGLGDGLESLGVHEHWNNPTDKQYSRNLGADEGIELVTWEPPAGADWTTRNWFGGFDDISHLEDNLVHCPDLGWLSVHVLDTESAFLYGNDMNDLAWFYTSDSLYPWIWCFQRGAWLWHSEDTWFYDPATVTWFSVE